MQTQNPFLDEFAKLTTAAMGIAQAAGEEAKAAMRAQADKLAAEFDLVRRDEHEALKAEVAALRAAVAALAIPAAEPKKPAKPKKTAAADG
jgi:BMFP domain-containing protein YqiC